ncbi:MAG: 3-deoxy-manno-octulosonate cytidylyltransferase [Flavobacterium sp. BFFFF2]|nr:MAG: 3-deoxy-manno-octulosonate cytidylyltransferase [Flavobacterium sp. BFFFF2]
MKPYLIVIPARLASTRLPEKPLVDILGKSLLQRTFEQCLLASPKEYIVVATDDLKISNHCEERGIPVIMTSTDCLTGTDRVAEVAQQIEANYYINVQGDEPVINPDDIRDMIQAAVQYPDCILNGYTAIDSEEDYRSLTIPKVVFKPNGDLLYMSRSPIPGNKKNEFQKSWRQVCIYGFPKSALEAFVSVTEKTPLENEEDIEVLRFLELDFTVKMLPMSNDSIAVDTPEDIHKVIHRLTQHG